MFLATILVMNFYFCCCCSLGAMINSGSPVLSVAQLRARWLLSCLLPGAGAGGVSHAAADRAERDDGDIGAEADQPSQHQQRGQPAPCVCIETESRSEVKSQVCIDYDESEVIKSFCIL